MMSRAEYPTPIKNTYNAVRFELALIMEMTKAKRHQDVASSTAAADIVMLPTLVLRRLSSVRMRAKTGKAVIAMATPRKRR